MNPRTRGDIVSVAIVAAIMALPYMLPPDTSLRLVQERGTLRMCIPSAYPPLVAADGEERPGIDVEIMSAIADRLDVRLNTVTNNAIGRDFNPRNWRVTRAQCEVIGGGVVTRGITASFLETTPPHLETGWAIVAPADLQSLDGASIGFVPGASGLDRIALSTYLRSVGARAKILESSGLAHEALLQGEVSVVATEGLQARRLAEKIGYAVEYLPSPLERYPIGFGLWKGDLTLKRAIVSALEELRADGRIDVIIESYELAPIDLCKVCPPRPRQRGVAIR